jgi:large subunit ribosomal protein L24
MQKILKKKKKMHVKVGEKVKIISGSYKGKEGLIKKILKQTNQVIIEGINVKTKHNKSTKPGEDSYIARIEYPIDSSNILRYKD